MPNLVGIGNSQVPTNAMLGGLAYQDSVGEINLDKIKERTSDTATDIFVYDTRKDSDGGAWRKRTQNTSWYNESVSQARGARKEFPAVAVLVAYNNGLVIYDGDDPNLPMWMEAWQYQNNSSGNTNWWGGSGTGTSVAAMNGMVVLTTTTGVKNLHFINDRMSVFYTPASGNYSQPGGISNRNVPYVAWYPSDEYYSQILNSNVKDVAMTVLPDAPIDVNTGLPFPTIAVATSAGVTVVKDRRDAVPNFSTLTPGGGVEMNSVSFDDNNNLVIGRNNFILYRSDHPHYLSNQVDNGYTVNNRKTSAPSVGEDSSGSTSLTDVVGISDSSIAFDTETLGLGLYDVNAQNNSNSMVAYIRDTHNTGWMHGDCKGVFLSSTDATNFTGTELIGNPGPFSNTTGWTADNGFLISESGNRLRIDSNGNAGSYFGAYYTFTTVVGKEYVIFINIHSQNAGTVVRLSGSGTYFTNTSLGTGIHYFQFTSDQASTTIRIGSNVGAGSNRIQEIIEVSVKEASPDRSVSNSNLQAHGAVHRNPVAPGAELVGYNNWFTGRFLQGAKNSLNWGTSDFFFTAWIKPDNINDDSPIIGYGDIGSNNGFLFYVNYVLSTPHIDVGYLGTNGSFAGNLSNNGAPMANGEWNHCCVVMKSNTFHLYVNGKEHSFTWTGSSVNWSTRWTSPHVVIGNRAGYEAANDPAHSGATYALIRASARAPSLAQIRKMYNDEKNLFRKNAKCTLHGTSNNVKALAFDDSTNVLHVGTPSGRSEFQGLNRINNTTTAVTTAISASNELVAEQ